MERIEKQMQFILEIDKEKQIKRKTLQSNGKDFEDDAQHAWHMAIMTLLLSEYANDEIDVLKTMSILDFGWDFTNLWILLFFCI